MVVVIRSAIVEASADLCDMYEEVKTLNPAS